MHLAQTPCRRTSQSPSSISSPSFCLHRTTGVLPPPCLAPCAPWQVWGAAGPQHVLQLAHTAAGIWQAAVCFCTCKHGQLSTDVPLPVQVLIISLLSTGSLPTSCCPWQGPQHTPRAQPGIQGANLGSVSPRSAPNTATPGSLCSPSAPAQEGRDLPAFLLLSPAHPSQQAGSQSTITSRRQFYWLTL